MFATRAKVQARLRRAHSTGAGGQREWLRDGRCKRPGWCARVANAGEREARFAAHYAVSKSRQKGWGRRKLEQGLRLKGVGDALIAEALRAIDAGEEEEQLRAAVAKRWERTKEADPFLRKAKVVRYFVGKGFGADQVEALLRAMVH